MNTKNNTLQARHKPIRALLHYNTMEIPFVIMSVLLFKRSFRRNFLFGRASYVKASRYLMMNLIGLFLCVHFDVYQNIIAIDPKKEILTPILYIDSNWFLCLYIFFGLKL